MTEYTLGLSTFLFSTGLIVVAGVWVASEIRAWMEDDGGDE